MKDIRLAKSAGFCFGVERAVQKVYDEVERNKGKVYTYGPIIHNDEVIKDLKSKGVDVIKDSEELKTAEQGTLVIRSHGVGKEVYKSCEETGFEIVDATCPYVRKIHRIVAAECEKGNKVIIVGNPAHPEVQGIKGWGDDSTVVIENYEDFTALGIKKDVKLYIVAQTTYNHKKFQELVDKIKVLEYDITCFNTICSATQERQTEAGKIAAEVDTMIVIGDKNSSNTTKLVDICENTCKKTIFIQTAKDLDTEELPKGQSIGITAGASTPKHIIEEVQNNVRSKF